MTVSCLRWIALGVLLAGLAFAAPADAAKSRGLMVPLKASEASGAPVEAEVELYSKSYALVIGIDRYAKGWPPLAKAVSDARRVARVLAGQGFEVTLKTDLKSDELETAFEDFFILKGDDPDSRLFVWFAGHGHTDQQGEGYLIPSDGALERSRVRFLRTALSLRDFGKFMRYAQSKHVFTIFDSCFAGTIFNVARAAPPPQITRITTRPVRQFLTSGDAGQTVSDDGTFAKLFIEALQGERRADGNGDGYLTASEMGSFLDAKMSNYTNNRQTPRYGKLSSPQFDKVDFVFALGKTAALTPKKKPAAPSAGLTPEMMFWQSIQGSTNAADYRDYLAQFPKGTFARLAKRRVKELTKQKTAALAPPKAASPSDIKIDTLKFDTDGMGIVAGRAAPGAVLVVKADDQVIGEVTADARGEWVLVPEKSLPSSARKIIVVSKNEGAKLAALLPPRQRPSPAAKPAVGTFPKALKPGDTFKDCAECPEMVVIPAGHFTMGSPASEPMQMGREEPQHRVTIPKHFAVGKFEVTFVEWESCVVADGCGGYWPKDTGLRPDSHPVIYVSWKDAKSFVSWLSRKTGKVYRLLTEAEWEYMARAGTTTAFHFGATITPDETNYDGNYAYAGGPKGIYRGKTVPVGSFTANAFGIHDVHGNVSEWVEDCLHFTYDGAPANGKAWTTGGDCSNRALRGGSWAHPPRLVRSAYRDFAGAADRGHPANGFRVARDLSR